MIPITRKEKYINEIVGGGDTAPKTPQTREEFFFAEILGEVVAPSPITRVEKYLSAIAGQYSGELPEPVTRIERFIARAAGMDVTIPTPITREEMFWADYALIVEKELSGIPPLTFNAVAGTLKNYRIYGNTVNGESVGDRTANLIQGSIKNANIGNNGKINTSNEFILVYAPVVTGESYTISNNNGTNVYAFYNVVPSTETETSYDNNRQIFSTSTITVVPPTTGYIAVRLANTAQDIMINPGSTALPYEPYGYKVPVTVEGKNLFSSRIEQGSFDGITGAPNNVSTRVRSHEDDYIFLTPGVYRISAIGVEHIVIKAYDLPDVSAFNYNLSMLNWVPLSSTITINTSAYYKFAFCKTNNPIITPSDVSNIMLNTGSTALPYEPYHAPVTTPIYLPEPIKMVGDEAEYIDYAEQKQHRVRKNLWDGEIESGSWMGFNADDEPYKVDYDIRCRSSKLIAVKNSSVYTISNHEPSTNVQVIVQYRDNNKKFINEYGWADFPCTFTTPSNAALIEFIIRKPSNLKIMPEDCGDIQLELGSTATEYEPYIENTDLDVTLPALPVLPGTNTLTVGTEVQPSNVYIKYEGER